MCSSAKWRNLPEHFGPWQSVYQRSDNGVKNACSSRFCATFIFACKKTTYRSECRNGRFHVSSGHPSSQRCWKRGSQESQHHCARRSRGVLPPPPNTSRLRKSWPPASQHAATGQAGLTCAISCRCWIKSTCLAARVAVQALPLYNCRQVL